MAMTKKEREMVEQLRLELRLAKAFCRTDVVEPDVKHPMPGEGYELLSTGWLFNSYSKEVVKACSSSTDHSYGRTDRTQYPRNLYSTKKRALMALRNAVENEAAIKLAEIDARIEKCDGE